MSRKGQIHRTKHLTGTAAAQCGVIGLPDPGLGPIFGPGQRAAAVCREINTAADAFLAHRSIECRQFLRNERYFAAVLR